MYVKLDGGEVQDVKLRIYEPPRFFEAFLRGRAFTEAPDITARICGICPIAYQMSAVRAMEDACGVAIDEGPLRDLRRLIYCGEWIESHACTCTCCTRRTSSATRALIEMARDHREIVEQGLADEEGRQRADRRWSAAARSTRSTSASAASTARPTAARAARRCVEPLRAGARDRARDGPLGRDAADSPTSSATPSCVALRDAATRTRSTAARSSPTAGSTSRPASSTSTSSRSTSSTPTRCTPASASAAPT